MDDCSSLLLPDDLLCANDDDLEVVAELLNCDSSIDFLEKEDDIFDGASSFTSSNPSSKPSSPYTTDEAYSVTSISDDEEEQPHRFPSHSTLLPPRPPELPKLPPSFLLPTKKEDHANPRRAKLVVPCLALQHSSSSTLNTTKAVPHADKKSGPLVDDNFSKRRKFSTSTSAASCTAGHLTTSALQNLDFSHLSNTLLNSSSAINPKGDKAELIAAAEKAVAEAQAASVAAAAERAAEAEQPKLTGEAKKEQRIQKNREAAERSRLKRKALLAVLPLENEALQNRMRELEAGLAASQSEVRKLQEQNDFLKQLIGPAAYACNLTSSVSSAVTAAASSIFSGSGGGPTRGAVDNTTVLPTTTTAAAASSTGRDDPAKAAFFGYSVPTLNAKGHDKNSGGGMMVLGVACLLSMHQLRLLFAAVGLLAHDERPSVLHQGTEKAYASTIRAVDFASAAGNTLDIVDTNEANSGGRVLLVGGETFTGEAFVSLGRGDDNSLSASHTASRPIAWLVVQYLLSAVILVLVIQFCSRIFPARTWKKLRMLIRASGVPVDQQRQQSSGLPSSHPPPNAPDPCFESSDSNEKPSQLDSRTRWRPNRRQGTCR